MKRCHNIPDDNRRDFVDDLAVAAEYAFATAPIPFSNEVKETDDQDEINLEESPSPDNSEIVQIDKSVNIASHFNDNTAEHVNDDDESDVDLEEQLRQMVDDEEEVPVSTATDHRPRTANEIDPYSSQRDALEFLFDVSNDEKIRLKNLTRNHLKIAGTVRHLLPSERTVVIQSKPGEVLLEEGTILVVCTTLVDDPSSESKIIPLGRVLEVFGPVSQPLYSVRLPEPLPTETTKEIDAKEVLPANEYDPWDETGDFTKLLKRDSNTFPIYYVPEGVRVIDPVLIMRASGRGSDASNFYDEEITNPNDLDYSDDEQERAAKRKGRPNRQETEGHIPHGALRAQYPPADADHIAAPHGFHYNPQRSIQNHPAQNQHFPPQHTGPPQYASNCQKNPGGAQAPSSQEDESDTVYF